MPIATSPQKEQVPVEFQDLLPKPPGYGRRLSPTDSIVSDGSELVELADLSQQYSSYSSTDSRHSNSASAAAQIRYFNPRSPPLLNLSPNLSPSEQSLRSSPVYDLRESTRRRSAINTGKLSPLDTDNTLKCNLEFKQTTYISMYIVLRKHFLGISEVNARDKSSLLIVDFKWLIMDDNF